MIFFEKKEDLEKFFLRRKFDDQRKRKTYTYYLEECLHVSRVSREIRSKTTISQHSQQILKF